MGALGVTGSPLAGIGSGAAGGAGGGFAATAGGFGAVWGDGLAVTRGGVGATWAGGLGDWASAGETSKPRPNAALAVVRRRLFLLRTFSSMFFAAVQAGLLARLTTSAEFQAGRCTGERPRGCRP